MPVVKIVKKGFGCSRCSHQWIPVKEDPQIPIVCPRCKSPYWDREKRR